jgi:hypothetical protein
MMAKLFKKRKHSSRTNNTQAVTTSPMVPVEKEQLVFEVAVMGYTLKSSRYDKGYVEKENIFLDQIKGDYTKRYPISKTYLDIAKEADVTIKLDSDNDPEEHYGCGRPNNISSTSYACIMFYDPTKKDCLVNLKSYFRTLSDNRERRDSPDAIVFLVGINGDKPEEHLLDSSEILELASFAKNKLTICPISLNPSANCAENVNIIIKNLAIACLKDYQNESEDIYTITSPEAKLRLSSPHPLVTAYSLFTTLNYANKQPAGIYGHSLPKELINYITLLLIQHDLPFFYKNPVLQLNIYKELLKDESDNSSVTLLTAKK